MQKGDVEILSHKNRLQKRFSRAAYFSLPLAWSFLPAILENINDQIILSLSLVPMRRVYVTVMVRNIYPAKYGQLGSIP